MIPATLIAQGYRARETTPGGEIRAVSLGSRPVSVFRPRLAGAVTTIAVAVVGALAATTLPGTAATEGSLQARAAIVESHLAADSAALHDNAIAYLSERRAYMNAAAAEAATESRVRRVQGALQTERAVVRRAALSAYVNAGQSNAFGLYLGGTPDNLATGATYTRAASDHIASSIALLNNDQLTLTSNLKTEHTELTTAASALKATTASRASVLTAVNAENTSLSSLNGALASLVRQQEIARERAAAEAAAQAAAAAAAANAASAPTVPSAGPPAVGSAPTVAVTSAAPSSLAAAFAAIRRCESSDDYSLSTGNGYYGAYQFSASTWAGLGESGLPSQASPAVQDAAAYKLYESSGWGAWPECAAVAGL
jgi:hypothetical protein